MLLFAEKADNAVLCMNVSRGEAEAAKPVQQCAKGIYNSRSTAAKISTN